MLHSLLIPLFIACRVTNSNAAPFILGGPHAGVTAASSFAEARVETAAPGPSEPPSSSPQGTSTSQVDGNQAEIVVVCQGCGIDGADAYPAFDFRFDTVSAEDCSTVFTINGTESRLSESHPHSTISLESHDSILYQLRTDLSCKLDLTDTEPRYLPVVSVSIEPPSSAVLVEHFGFTVAATHAGRISATTIFSEIRAGDFSATPSTSSTGSKEDALELLQKADALRSSLLERIRNDLLSKAQPTPTPEAPSGNIYSNQPQCNLAHLRNTASCAARQASQGIGGGVLSVIDHLQTSIGDDRAARFRNHVQSAMKAMEDRFDCTKEKHDKEKIVVTVTEVSPETAASTGVVALPKPQDLSKAPSGLVRALEVLAAALGIGGLLAFLRRRYCSLRRRVERLADREERVKARQYRRAARQEARRKRWANFKKTFTSCFTGAGSSEDEEKHALMLNAAEQGRSEASMREVTAHMNGVRYAHDITVQLARAGHFADLGPHFHGFAGAAVQQALEATFSRAPVGAARSRASSLPSYHSEVLPDYSSQPDMDSLANSVAIVDGFRRPASRTSTTGSSRFTPDSSIPDISTRPSFETLRTQASE